MWIQYLALQNFLSYRLRSELDFTGRRVTAIVGNNEAGKSSLLQAIYYLCYGKTRADQEQQLINDRATGDLIVEGKVVFDSETLTITRGRTRKNEAILKLAGYSGKPSSIAEVIADKIKLSSDDFVTLHYFMQGDIHQFMGGNKRAYFQRWTASLKLWKLLEDEAKQKEETIRQTISKINLAIQSAKETLRNTKEIKQELQKAKHDMQEATKQAEVAQAQVDKLKQIVLQADDTEHLRESLDDARSTSRELERMIDHVADQIKNNRSESRNLAQGMCPILRTECEQMLEASESKREKLRRDYLGYERQKKELEERLVSVKERYKTLTDRLQNDRSGVDEKARLEAAKRTLNICNSDLHACRIRHAKAAANYDTIYKAKTKIQAAQEKLIELSAELRDWQMIRYMCGASGIPAQVLERELFAVEKNCNWILGRLDYPKRIKFSGYRELAAYERICPRCGGSAWRNGACSECGEERPHRRKDEPTVTILDGQFERPFTLESGGAQVLQSFAVRLACGLFRASLAGFKVNMIMLDEVFAMLDASNRQKLMALIVNKLSSVFGLKQQLIVSHQSDVVDIVDDLIVVRKERGGSVARWS